MADSAAPVRVGILHPLSLDRSPTSPQSTDFGRAALLAQRVGIDVVLGDAARNGNLTGVKVRDGKWVPATNEVLAAALHRFPDADRPKAWQALHEGLAATPLINPVRIVRLCRDKHATHVALVEAGMAVPEQVRVTPGMVCPWDCAFLKPRFGAFGREVSVVHRHTTLPDRGEWVVQRAVAPPAGWAGVSVRVLVQREPNGEWVASPCAARVSRSDAVVNHARGAEVVPAADLFDEAAIAGVALQAARAIAQGPLAHHVGELGVDVVVDTHGVGWVIEVNGKPRGRLSALASRWPERFATARDEALLRPLRFAASFAALHPTSTEPSPR